MSRPDFMLRPLDWTRVSRTGQSRVDAACAITHNVRHRAHWSAADLVIAALAIGTLAAIFMGVI